MNLVGVTTEIKAKKRKAKNGGNGSKVKDDDGIKKFQKLQLINNSSSN